jgi:hypothetical protein
MASVSRDHFRLPMGNMANTALGNLPRGERIKVELREFAILATYLFVCFSALAGFKAAILSAQGISFSPWLFALIKALVCAKFLLVGRWFGLGDGLAAKYPLIVSTLYRSMTFLLVLGLLTVIEEAVVGHFHGETLGASLGRIGGGTFAQFVATSVILLLVLVPFFAFRALGEITGEKTLVQLYFEPRNKTVPTRFADRE